MKTGDGKEGWRTLTEGVSDSLIYNSTFYRNHILNA